MLKQSLLKKHPIKNKTKQKQNKTKKPKKTAVWSH